MSSQAYSRVAAIVTALLVLAVPLAGCGKDSESPTEVADRVSTTPTTETTPSTATTSTEAERAAARRAARRTAARRAAAKRARLREERKARKARQARLEQERREQAKTETTPPATTVVPEPPVKQPKPKPKPPAQTGPTVHRISEAATLKLVTKKGINFVQEGAVTGTVNGTMRLDAKLGGKGVVGTFTVTLKDGTLTGQASAALTLAGSVARFNGTATLARGTGAYADLVPAQLAFSGSVASDASTSNVKLSGDVRY